MEIQTMRQLCASALGRRAELGLSQDAVATRAGVSRKWLSDFESGKTTVEAGKVLDVLDILGLRLSLAPRDAADLPEDLDDVLNSYEAGDW